MARRKTIYVDSDILVVGGGFGGCGAAYESRYWGRDKKVVIVEKANIERSGAVTPSTATWVCSGMRTNRKITFAMLGLI
jgi:adenylylsulfate reductase subunit A